MESAEQLSKTLERLKADATRHVRESSEIPTAPEQPTTPSQKAPYITPDWIRDRF